MELERGAFQIQGGTKYILCALILATLQSFNRFRTFLKVNLGVFFVLVSSARGFLRACCCTGNSIIVVVRF